MILPLLLNMQKCPQLIRLPNNFEEKYEIVLDEEEDGSSDEREDGSSWSVKQAKGAVQIVETLQIVNKAARKTTKLVK